MDDVCISVLNILTLRYTFPIKTASGFDRRKKHVLYLLPIGVHKPGSQYSPAIYTMDIAYKIDIPLYIFDRYITGI